MLKQYKYEALGLGFTVAADVQGTRTDAFCQVERVWTNGLVFDFEEVYFFDGLDANKKPMYRSMEDDIIDSILEGNCNEA